MQAYEYLHHIHLTGPLQEKQRCTPNLATSMLIAMSLEDHFHLHPPLCAGGIYDGANLYGPPRIWSLVCFLAGPAHQGSSFEVNTGSPVAQPV
jgi:hypothetical protein